MKDVADGRTDGCGSVEVGFGRASPMLLRTIGSGPPPTVIVFTALDRGFTLAVSPHAIDLTLTFICDGESRVVVEGRSRTQSTAVPV